MSDSEVHCLGIHAFAASALVNVRVIEPPPPIQAPSLVREVLVPAVPPRARRMAWRLHAHAATATAPAAAAATRVIVVFALAHKGCERGELVRQTTTWSR